MVKDASADDCHTWCSVQSLASEMCSGSEAGSCLRLIDLVYHSTLGLRVIKKKKKVGGKGFRVSGFRFRLGFGVWG